MIHLSFVKIVFSDTSYYITYNWAFQQKQIPISAEYSLYMLITLSIKLFDRDLFYLEASLSAKDTGFDREVSSRSGSFLLTASHKSLIIIL